jgi:hypothetical protein
LEIAMGVLRHEEKLEGVAISLALAVKLGVARVSFDCVVSEGLRSREKMMINFGKGRSAAECIACGVPESYAVPSASKVTWLKDPFSSKHGSGRAVDVYPLVKGKLATTSLHLPLFRALYEAIMSAGWETHTALRYGGDWDEDGKLFERGESDAVHFELTDRTITPDEYEASQ